MAIMSYQRDLSYTHSSFEYKELPLHMLILYGEYDMYRGADGEIIVFALGKSEGVNGLSYKFSSRYMQFREEDEIARQMCKELNTYLLKESLSSRQLSDEVFKIVRENEMKSFMNYIKEV